MNLLDNGAAMAVVVGLFGLATGSFLNVVAYRVPRRDSLWRSSACPHCGHSIRFIDITPVAAWIWLRGKCRDCKSGIASRYPLVEAMTGVLWAGIAFAVGAQWVLLGWLWLGSLALALALLLIDRSSIPRSFTVSGVTIGVALLVLGLVADAV